MALTATSRDATADPRPMVAAWNRSLGLTDLAQIRQFLRLFLTVTLASFLLWQSSLYADALLENRQRQAAMAEAARHARDYLGEALQTYAADLQILASSRALGRLIAGDTSAQPGAALDFALFASEKPAYQQVRYLDQRGQEVVRVDRHDDTVEIVEEAALQNKADRYYFRDAVDLPADGLYISALDLNVEHGGIEVPWRPMLRLVTPVQGPEGERRGVVVLNVSAARFIAAIERARPTNSTPIQLLNRQGYWLAGVEPDRLWGFMFGRETTMARSAPEFWQRVLEADNGSLESGGDRWLYETLRPQSYLGRQFDASAIRAADAEWKIVCRVPGVSLTQLWSLDHLPIALVGLLGIAAVCLGWSRASAARREAETRKHAAESELVRVERLASLGSLVAGVAHELNTPIGSAVTVASTLSEQVTQFSDEVESGRIGRQRLGDFITELREGTRIMLRGLERAAKLILHFKQVAVDQTSEQRRTFRVEELVQDVVTSVEPQFKHGDVTLEARIASQASLDSYPGPLGQVLMNLVANARIHGFDDGQAGRVTIEARDISAREIELVVRDTGKGVPDELAERIFEPFVTTRLGEGGSGLGLSIVLNIVTNMLGGTIRVESAPDSGTAMVLRLPTHAPTEPDSQTRRVYGVAA